MITTKSRKHTSKIVPNETVIGLTVMYILLRLKTPPRTAMRLYKEDCAGHVTKQFTRFYQNDLGSGPRYNRQEGIKVQVV